MDRMVDGSYANHDGADRKLARRPTRDHFPMWENTCTISGVGPFARPGSVGLVKRRCALKAILSSEYVFIESPSGAVISRDHRLRN